MKISKTDYKKYSVIKVEGSLSSENKKELEDQFSSLISKQKHMILDMSELVYLSSLILSTLLYYSAKCKEANIFFRLVNLNEEIKKLFAITEVDTHLDIFNTVENAVRDL